MRISYGSSDVCSSDLVTARACPDRPPGGRRCGSLHSVGRPLLPDREARVHLTPDSGLMLPAPRVTQGIAWATIAAFVLLFVSGSGAREAYAYMAGLVQIGRAHVGTPVTNAHLVCRLLLEKKTNRTM